MSITSCHIPYRHSCRTCLLLSGRCLSKQTRRIQDPRHTSFHVCTSFGWCLCIIITASCPLCNKLGREFLTVFLWRLAMLRPQKSGQVDSLGEKVGRLVKIIHRNDSNSTICGLAFLLPVTFVLETQAIDS